MGKKAQVISAVSLAATSNVSNSTNDRVQALKGGHGMLNISAMVAADVIANEMINGADIDIKFADKVRLPVDDIMEKAINATKDAGADSANAALIVATLMYLAGSSAQVGIPAGNRKLGATARMLAKVDRSGVAMMPTAKKNNKISGFPAVQAVYKAMIAGELSPIDGRNVPPLAAGGPLYGHSALGEDIVWPAMAENGARVGTQAMMDAMAGASMHPDPLTAAIFGAAAVLEIIHPDAEVPEELGPYTRMTSATLVGKTAAETAGLPEKLHVKITGQEYDTAQVIGDIGLILKDVGGVSVIGMMAFEEIFAIFEEGIAGFSGGPVNAPLGHILAYAVIGMKLLIENNSNQSEIAKKIEEDRGAGNFDPQSALTSINIIARKASEIYRGPVTSLLIHATEPARAHSIYYRANTAYDMLSDGDSLEEVVKYFDQKRVETIEKNASRILSGMTNKEIKFEVLKIVNGARRDHSLARKYIAFDPLIDLKVHIDGEEFLLESYVDKVLPQIAQGELEDKREAASLAAPVVSELVLAGGVIFNITVPAAVACAMELHSPKEAAGIAEKAAKITAGTPGGKAAAREVGRLAQLIMTSEYGGYDK